MSWWSDDVEEERLADEDDDGLVEKESDFNTQTDRIIFLIDGRSAMQNNNVTSRFGVGGFGGEESQLHHCLRFAVSVMKLCIVKDSTCVGIVLLGAVSFEK
jgi:hypothetical protein